MLSTTNLDGEEIVDAPGKDGNASMLEQVKRPNPWRKVMMMISGSLQIIGCLGLLIIIFSRYICIIHHCANSAGYT
jgi:hypothetical protein